jgi:transcriptional regulator with XRE-family HTH domain
MIIHPLRRRRIEQGLTQVAFAKRIHWQVGLLSVVENGKKKPSFKMLRRLMEAERLSEHEAEELCGF